LKSVSMSVLEFRDFSAGWMGAERRYVRTDMNAAFCLAASGTLPSFEHHASSVTLGRLISSVGTEGRIPH